MDDSLTMILFHFTGCNVYAYCCGVGGIVSICTMAMIARERYSAISRDMLPFQMKESPGVKKPVTILMLVWIFASVMLAPPLFGWSRYVVDGHGTSCTFDYVSQTASNRNFYLFLFICGFSFPLFVTVYYYMRLVFHVKSHDRQLGSQQCQSLQRYPIRRQHWRRREMKLCRSCALVVITFVIAWTPYAVVALLSIFGVQGHLTPLTSLIPGLFAKACVIHNPIIYSLTHPRFKTALLSVLKIHCSWYK